MAENGNLNNNINIYTPSNSVGRTESDATHYRLRGDLHPKEYYICRSCGQRFESTSLMQVYEHYGENEHKNYFKLCFYCSGKVHHYLEERTNRLQVYHSCLRWKRGEDK